MIKLTPSLLAADLMNLGKDLEKMLNNGVDQLHFDVMDAHFVPNLSFGPSFCQAIHSHFPTLKIDVHLMMDNPQKYLDAFAQSGASSITFHQEAVPDPAFLIREIKKRGVTCGMSVKPGTPADWRAGIHAGAGGEDQVPPKQRLSGRYRRGRRGEPG